MKRWFWSGLVFAACHGAPPEVPPIALTPTEYNNTVRDLLGMPMSASGWPDAPAIAARLNPPEGEQAGLFGSAPIEIEPWPYTFPEEIGVEGFEGMADGQQPSPFRVEEIQKSATLYAAFTLVSPVFFTCDGWEQASQETQESCGWASLNRFAQRAWRRPMTEEERTRLQAFWEGQLSQGTPEEAVVLSAAAVLQSPAFLYRVEGGTSAKQENGVARLNDWEIASRLSYFLWDSMPDAALFEAASKGKLSTRAQVRKQAERMLEDPRARSSVVHFHHQWLGTNRVTSISPARRAFAKFYGIPAEPAQDTTDDGAWPGILGPIRHSFAAETKLFVEKTVFEGQGTFEALMTSHHGYMSDATRSIYGDDARVLEGDSVFEDYGVVIFSQGGKNQLELYPAEFPADQRSGLLTMPSVLALGAYPVHPAPVLRGKRILERIACQPLGSPPPGAEAEFPADISEAESTNRKRTEEATRPAHCAVCHDNINPPGFAFESYDAMGRWRTEDNGYAVDTTGQFELYSGEQISFQSGVDLAHKLAKSEQVLNCYTLHWARYATGADLEDDNPTVIKLQKQFRKKDDVKALLADLAASDLMRFRSAGGDQ